LAKAAIASLFTGDKPVLKRLRSPLTKVSALPLLGVFTKSCQLAISPSPANTNNMGGIFDIVLLPGFEDIRLFIYIDITGYEYQICASIDEKNFISKSFSSY
jgi:hypothetical protein